MNGGQLIIYRAANLGETLFVTIDGVAKGQVRRGDTYTGALSPGQHVLSVILQPNNLNLPPTVKKLTIEKGKTYAFTAMWAGDNSRFALIKRAFLGPVFSRKTRDGTKVPFNG